MRNCHSSKPVALTLTVLSVLVKCISAVSVHSFRTCRQTVGSWNVLAIAKHVGKTKKNIVQIDITV